MAKAKRNQARSYLRYERIDLTPREMDVLRLMAAGLRTKRIGEQLGISTNTVTGCLRRARLFFRAANLVQLGIYYERYSKAPAAHADRTPQKAGPYVRDLTLNSI